MLTDLFWWLVKEKLFGLKRAGNDGLDVAIEVLLGKSKPISPIKSGNIRRRAIAEMTDQIDLIGQKVLLI